MKEKIKNFLHSKNLWSSILEILCGVILILVGYFSGFASGLFVEDDIRSQLIDTINDELKKPKIEPKKQNDNITYYSAYDTIGKYTKVYLELTEDIAFLYEYFETETQISEPFNLYTGFSDNIFIDFSISYTGLIPYEENFYIEFTFNEDSFHSFFSFSYYQSEIDEVLYSENIENYFNGVGDFSEFLIAANLYFEFLEENYLNNSIFYNESVFEPLTDYNFILSFVGTYDIQTSSMSFINAFLTGAAELVSSFGAVLSAAVLSVGFIFYNDGGLTIIGAAMAFALVVGVVYLIFRMVRGLVKQNNRG